MRVFLVALVSAAAAVGAACGGGNGNALPTGPTPVSANVEFELTATAKATAERVEGAAADSAITACGGMVRLHPSWWSFAQVTMVATETDRFGLYFDQVPVGRQSVELTVPEGCAGIGLTANGVALAGDEKGAFVFVVNPDGSITR